MKVRVYYDGYNDKYLPQYKAWWGGWLTLTETELGYGGSYTVKIDFDNKDHAIKYLNNLKKKREEERERETAAKKRAKISGVVYEDII